MTFAFCLKIRHNLKVLNKHHVDLFLNLHTLELFLSACYFVLISLVGFPYPSLLGGVGPVTTNDTYVNMNLSTLDIDLVWCFSTSTMSHILCNISMILSHLTTLESFIDQLKVDNFPPLLFRKRKQRVIDWFMMRLNANTLLTMSIICSTMKQWFILTLWD